MKAADSALRARLFPYLGDHLPENLSGSHLEATSSILTDAARWKTVAGDEWPTAILSEPDVQARSYRALAQGARDLYSAGRLLGAQLGRLESCETGSEIEGLAAFANRILSINPIPESWCSIEAVSRVQERVSAAQILLSQLVRAEEELSKHYDLELVEHVDDAWILRFRADYQSFWARLGPQFRRERRLIRGYSKQPEKFTLDSATRAVVSVSEIRLVRSKWQVTANELATLCRERFQDRQTNWETLLADLSRVSGILRESGSHHELVLNFLMDDAARRALASSADRVAHCSLDFRTLGGRVSFSPLATTGSPSLHLLATEFDAYAASLEQVAHAMVAIGDCQRVPRDIVELNEVLNNLRAVCELYREVDTFKRPMVESLGDWYKDLETDVESMAGALAWTHDLLQLSPSPIPIQLSTQVLAPSDATSITAAHLRLAHASTKLRDAIRATCERFELGRLPWRDWEHTKLMAIVQWAEEISAHADEVHDWIDYREACAHLDSLLGAKVLESLRSTIDDAELIPAAVIRHVYMTWLDHNYGAVAELRTAPREIEAIRAEFRKLDSSFPEAARARVRQKCFEKFPRSTQSQVQVGQFGLLMYQLSKRRPQLSVRKLMAAAPNVVQSLKPCFLMSPLAVSQFLPRGVGEDGLAFDTIIFDEASQVKPEDAIPAISRGRQVIVVGDRQQLPPSRFFESVDTEVDVDDDRQESTFHINRLSGVESVLDVMVGLASSGVHEVFLEVHYRSRHDDLIRYSNHNFYDDRLITFPSATFGHHGLGVRSIYLPHGRFDAGASCTNRAEAERVVTLLFELLESRPPIESIGVVALSRAQADLIERLVTERRIDESRFDDRFSDQQNEPIFIKNLENVQGDERDHILLSIGYGPTKGTGLTPNRFGPVNSEGGARRLNVAVSRARRSMTVIHSMRPEEIHAENAGARLLRRYLEFAQNARALEGAITTNPDVEAESPFEEAVGRALEQRGYRIRRQVGCAKYFIDIAVVSEDGQGFDLGIECDGATYHRSPAARDRDWLRQQILERLGWTIHRVWSTAWIRSPGAEVLALEAAIGEARSKKRAGLAIDDCAAAPPAVTPGGLKAESIVDCSGQMPLFDPYVEVKLKRARGESDLVTCEVSRIAELVHKIVHTEEPVHVDVVVERIRRSFGIQRAGASIQAAIMSGIDDAVSRLGVRWLRVSETGEKERSFLWRKKHGEIRPRGPTEGGSVRKANHIALVEIEAGVLKLVADSFGATRAEVVTEVARALGFGRVGSVVDERIGAAVERLVASRRLLLVNETLSVPPTNRD